MLDNTKEIVYPMLIELEALVKLGGHGNDIHKSLRKRQTGKRAVNP